MTPERNNESDAEQSLRATWSIGPLRPWLKMLAERQLPPGLRGKLDASDVVQQTLIDAWQGQSGFRGTTHGERLAWLRVILTRVVMRADRDLLKTAKRGEGREKTIQSAIDQASVRIEQLAIGNERNPVSAAVRAEQTLKLAAAMEQLPDDYRKVLELRHLEGLSHAENRPTNRPHLRSHKNALGASVGSAEKDLLGFATPFRMQIEYFQIICHCCGASARWL